MNGRLLQFTSLRLLRAAAALHYLLFSPLSPPSPLLLCLCECNCQCGKQIAVADLRWNPSRAAAALPIVDLVAAGSV